MNQEDQNNYRQLRRSFVRITGGRNPELIGLEGRVHFVEFLRDKAILHLQVKGVGKRTVEATAVEVIEAGTPGSLTGLPPIPDVPARHRGKRNHER